MCNEMKLDERSNVIFAGVNCGGVLAKLAGLITQRHSVSFVSFPVTNDFFTWEFSLDKSHAGLITNIYNYEGLFSEQEPGIANNIGVLWIPTSAVRRDSIYQSFCTMAVSCGSNKYEEYCRAAIGDDMDEIHKFYGN